MEWWVDRIRGCVVSSQWSERNIVGQNLFHVEYVYWWHLCRAILSERRGSPSWRHCESIINTYNLWTENKNMFFKWRLVNTLCIFERSKIRNISFTHPDGNYSDGGTTNTQRQPQPVGHLLWVWNHACRWLMWPPCPQSPQTWQNKTRFHLWALLNRSCIAFPVQSRW